MINTDEENTVILLKQLQREVTYDVPDLDSGNEIDIYPFKKHLSYLALLDMKHKAIPTLIKIHQGQKTQIISELIRDIILSDRSERSLDLFEQSGLQLT